MPPKKVKDIQYYEAVGRRKSAVARVRLYIPAKDKTVTVGPNKIKQGEIYLNSKPITETFSSSVEKAKYNYPLKLSKVEDRFAISILIKGGGKSGQLDAVVHGLARAIEKVDRDGFRPALKKQGLLTRDARIRERRKVGTGGRARHKKQSPKR